MMLLASAVLGRFLVGGLVLGWIGAAHAHQPVKGVLQALTTEDGLPINWVAAFLQDPDGALWIGTDSGLVWYDGVESAEVPELDGVRILQLNMDPRGVGWIASRETLWRLDDGVFQRVPMEPPHRGMPLHVDGTGEVWISGDTGLTRVDDPNRHLDTPDGCGQVEVGQGASLWCAGSGVPLALEDGVLRVLRDVAGAPLPGPELLRDSRGISWVHTPGRVHRYIREAGGFRELEVQEALAVEAIGILEARSGEIWINTDDHRVLVWDGVALREHARLRSTVRALYEDREGSIWAATRGLGALRLSSPQSFSVLDSGFGEAPVWTSMVTSSGSLILATDDGVFQRSPSGEIRALPGIAKASVYALHVTDDGSVLVGGYDGLHRWTGEAMERLAFAEPGVLLRGGVLEDRAGRIWAGGRYAIWRSEGRDQPLARLPLPVELGTGYPVVGPIVEDPDGQVWAATNAGLIRWGAAGVEVFNLGPVRGVAVGPKGKVWATLARGGLVRVVDGVVQELGAAQGIPSGTLHTVAFDNHGSVWLPSNRGVFRTSAEGLDALASDPQRTLFFHTYGVEDGLPSLECNSGHPAAMVDGQGRVHIPTMRGLVQVDPGELRRDMAAPVVTIRRVEVDGEAVPWNGTLVLPPHARSLAIHYSAPALRDPAGVTYRYRLEGHQDDWVEAERRRVAFWTNLEAGTHTFRLQARSGEGVLSAEDALLPFTVEARLVDRTWFRLLVGLGVLALGAVLVRVQLHRIRERELTALVDERTAELRAARDRSREQAARLQTQAHELEKVDARKTRFFANVSHELRTPLSLIRGPVSGALSSGQSLGPVDLARVARSAHRLEVLIEELLDIARLDAGRLPLRAREADLAGFVAERVDAFAPLAEQRGVDLSLGSVPVTAWFDEARLAKVVDNVVANALRHTAAGGTVDVRLTTTPTHGCIDVQDSGSGIAPEHLPHIFDRFYQAPDGSGALSGSAGLGLALSRELARRHGGELTAHSEVGAGSLFTLRLPLGRDHLADEDVIVGVEPPRPTAPVIPIVLPEAEDAAAATATATVLVVEDDEELRSWICQVLRARYTVLEAGDGGQGLQLARAHVPDVVLTDAVMPVMSGLELCRALRDDPATCHLPVVMLSARSEADRRVEGLASGVDAYLGKPFHPHELLLQLDNLLVARSRLRARHHRQLVMADDTPEQASVDDRFLAQVREAIHAHLPDEDFGVRGLADAVSLSRRQLGRKLDALIGQPPSTLIRQIRLQRARALLEQDAGSISEVAYAVGFRRPGRFSEQFKAEFGMTPTEFKASQG